MKNEKYWNKRFDEIFKQNINERAIYEEYKKAFDEIEKALKKLHKKFKSQGDITRSEICRSRQYIYILNILNAQNKRLRSSLSNEITETLKKCYEETYIATQKITVSDKENAVHNGEAFAIQNENAIKTALSSRWSGENYSMRIWKNTSSLARDVKDQIVNEIITGRSYKSIALTIKEKYNQSFYRASTLIRTEASAVQNRAAMNAYKESGTQKVRIHSANDERRCLKCKEASSKEYIIGTEPILPLHPNCRCRYIAVAKYSDDEVDNDVINISVKEL